MSFTFESAIGVLHNVAKNENHRQTFRDLKLVDIVGNFLKHENVPKITMLVLLTLALIIDENQTDLLFSHESSFNLLIRLAKRAWKGPDHRYDGFSLEELVLGLKGLSKNDKVKRLLVDKDILSLVSDILVDGKEDEKDIAAKLLWELSFDSTNKTVILGTELLMTTLKSVSKNSGKVARSCQGVLWVLEMEAADNVKAPKKKKKAETEKAVPESAGHVMISYNWGDQKQLLKVKESLKQLGFSIWMDVDNISGSTLQAMAEAVEGSSAVLVCMSEKYKESINCRSGVHIPADTLKLLVDRLTGTETSSPSFHNVVTLSALCTFYQDMSSKAEYAFSLKKPIIPLLMQEGYKADGWLGILLGTKLFFDFSGRFSFESKLSELEKELNGRGISATAGDDKVDGPIVKVAAPLVGKGPSKNQNMTEVDVKAWVLEHQLDKLSIFNSMQAKHLSFLKKISMKAPEFYYSFLLDLMHDKISMEDLNNLLRITDAVGKLPS